MGVHLGAVIVITYTLSSHFGIHENGWHEWGGGVPGLQALPSLLGSCGLRNGTMEVSGLFSPHG
jgi:hypothetical protein